MKTWKLLYFGVFFLLVASLCSCKSTQKGTITDYEISSDVLKNEMNPATVYEKLVDRYINLDTTLTEKEVKLLYYGQLLLPNFLSYNQPEFSEIQEDISNKKMMSATEKLDSILIKYPINLKANYLRTYLSHEMDAKDIQTKKRIVLLNLLFDAILSTGDGESKKNAIDVISVADEYFICYNVLFTGDVTGQALIMNKTRVYDKLTVEPSKNFNKKEVWFDITNFFGKQF